MKKRIKKDANKTDIKEIILAVEAELNAVLNKISIKKTEKLINSILSANRIFIAGQGRSGLVGETFAMRLMQLGLKAYVVGDVITPAIKNKDLLIVISGTGETQITLDIVNGAVKQKVAVCAITSNKISRIAKTAGFVIEIKSKINHKVEPLGSLFEQAAFLYLDSIVICLMNKLHERSADLRKRHANL